MKKKKLTKCVYCEVCGMPNSNQNLIKELSESSKQYVCSACEDYIQWLKDGFYA